GFRQIRQREDRGQAQNARGSPLRAQRALHVHRRSHAAADLPEAVMLEIVRPGAAAPGARAALFDFDGTLSLIRSGWLDIMLDMMVDTLRPLAPDASAEQLRAEALDLVWPLTGKDTIFQMIAFAGAIRA